MGRSGVFSGLRRHRRALCLGLAYGLLLNALLAIGFSVRAAAAALDPLAAASLCDSSNIPAGGEPARQGSPHQPDCTLCGPACPMMGAALQGFGGSFAIAATPAAAFGLDVAAPRISGVTPPSVYLSDTAAQAPPAIA